MDRDLALQTTAALTNIKNTLSLIANGTTPAEVSPSVNADDTRAAAPEEEPEFLAEEPEAPAEEPETRTKK